MHEIFGEIKMPRLRQGNILFCGEDGTGAPFVNITDIYNHKGIVDNTKLEKIEITKNEINRFPSLY